MKLNRTLLLFAIAYPSIFLFSAIAPSSRAVWIAEIIPAVAIFTAILWLSRSFQFSQTAYLLMFYCNSSVLAVIQLK
ncbi:hypothetical protein BOO91_10480 [Vibrio navarrensis]|nr:hypothetical protein [Vibrio navarrensis]MBE3657572.1 hypothetical protein [Vibrio navarrensis]MBE3661347.1 hypothetical protein [Vibrio navarrensis]MBE4602540.1 hypothetical protein [Vibrio navarrensis]